MRDNKNTPIKYSNSENTFNIVFLISIILTTSRAAWIGITLTVPLLIGLRSLYWFLPILFLITLLIASCIYPILGSNIQEFLRIYIPQNIWEEFTPLEFINQPMSRIEIWDNAVDSISNNLFFGSGASSFPFYLKGNNYFVHWHAHNLPLDIALSFGLPVMFILITTIFILTFISFKKIYIKNKLNLELLTERAWITSLIIIMMTHLVDIQYFDGRISITSWFLLAGMNCMIRDNSQSITR